MLPLRPLAVAVLLLASLSSAETQTSLPPGHYVCDVPAIRGRLLLDIGDGRYTLLDGKSGEFTIKEDLIIFSSGPVAGQHSKILGPGQFGLLTPRTGRFYSVCNLKS